MIVLGSFSVGALSQRSIEPIPIKSAPQLLTAIFSASDVSILSLQKTKTFSVVFYQICL
jgi:hypothetical protein